MATKQQIFNDFTQAFKNKDEVKKRTLESIKSEILVFEKQKEGNEATAEKIMEILKSMAKKRREALDAYKSAGRDELAKREQEELTIIESYLPEQMNESQIREVIKNIITAQNFTAADFGKAMSAVMAELKNKADGGLVGKVVKEILNS